MRHVATAAAELSKPVHDAFGFSPSPRMRGEGGRRPDEGRGRLCDVLDFVPEAALDMKLTRGALGGFNPEVQHG